MELGKFRKVRKFEGFGVVKFGAGEVLGEDSPVFSAVLDNAPVLRG
jgi:hypothetical protein